MKNVKRFFLFCILFLVCMVSVLAINTGEEGGGQGTGIFQDLSGAKNVWPTMKSNGLAVRGLRIAFVDANGMQIGSSQDFILSEQYNEIRNTEVYYTEVKGNKVSYNSGVYSVGGWTKKKVNEIPRVSSSRDLESKYVSSGFMGAFNINNALTNWNFSNLFAGITREANSSWGDEKYRKVLIDFLTYLSASNFETVYNTGRNDVMMVVEPLTMMKLQNEFYLGTNHELAIKAQTVAHDPNAVPACNGTQNGALCDLGVALRNTIPCSSVLDGSLATKLQTLNSASGSNKYGALVNSFNQSTYFNGHIKIDTTNMRNYCNGGRIPYEKITADYGVGMYLFWVGELIDNSKLSCSIVQQGLNTSALEREIESYYRQGNLSSFYNKYASGISYTKKDNTKGRVDAQWYVNECTCYGMYNYFKEDYIASYKNANSSNINQSTTILGSSDWTSTFNNIHMFNLTKDKINSLLVTKFNDYNTKYTNYVNSLNSKNADDYSWTKVDSTKYFKTLNCGSAGIPPQKESCSTLQKWYNANKPSGYQDITKLTASQIRGSYRTEVQNMFNAYNSFNSISTGKYWTIDANTGVNQSYIARCINEIEEPPKPETNNYSCDPNKNVSSCYTGSSQYYKDMGQSGIDSEYWDNCVFNDKGKYEDAIHKTSQNTGTLSYYEPNLGDSEYCPVYCIEEVDLSLRPGGFSVPAGGHFTWEGHHVSGSRTCKTKEVDYDQFKKDLTSANSKVEKEYLNYQLEQAKRNSVNSAKKTANSTKCPVYDTDTISLSSHFVNGQCVSGNCFEEHPGYSCYNERRSEDYACGADGKDTCYDWTKTCSKTSISHYGTYYEASKVSINVSVNGKNHNLTWAGANWCSYDSAPKIDSAMANGTYYNQAVREVNAIVDRMKNCYTWNADDVYHIDPQLTVSYSDSNLYSYTGSLVKNKTNPYYTITGDSSNDCTTDGTAYKLSCSGGKCTNVSAGVEKCTNVSETRRASVSFNISDDVYRYVLKDTHQSIHDVGPLNSSNSTINYVTLDRGNFPISYATPDGWYGASYNRGILNISYSKLGHVRSGDTTTAVDTILNNEDNTNYGKWECDYHVTSDLITQDKGIRVIYRPIDLNNPFPDIDASGRSTGSNWCDADSCSNRNYVVSNYILNNRNAQGYDVYQKDPMYTFVLTPAVINEIRQYNKQNGYDKYTGSLNNQTYDFVCATGTGGTCISEYLTHIIDITDARNQPGACVQDKYRNSNDSTSFNNCRYQ